MNVDVGKHALTKLCVVTVQQCWIIYVDVGKHALTKLCVVPSQQCWILY